MSARIFALPCGYVSVAPCAGGCCVTFTLRGLPEGSYRCLAYDGKTRVCGTCGGNARISARLPKAGVNSFGVSRDGSLIAFTGSPEARAAMERGDECTADFFEKNRAHFERLLAGERISELEELLPSSRFALVRSSQGDYAVGVIYDELSQPLYVCYGTHGEADQQPPEDVRPYCRWLPAGGGYWVIYQDAATGHALPAEAKED